VGHFTDVGPMFRGPVAQMMSAKEERDAKIDGNRALASPALHGCHARDDAAGCRRTLEAELMRLERSMRVRRIVYALASLAALGLAVGAGWRPG
jgi:hypothetical protein